MRPNGTVVPPSKAEALERTQEIANGISLLFPDRFISLKRGPYDRDDGKPTILGGTLWSNLPPDHVAEVNENLVAYNEVRDVPRLDSG